MIWPRSWIGWNELKVKKIYVERGIPLKRFHARAKGRGNRVTKHSCHIFVVVGDEEKKKGPAKPAKSAAKPATAKK